MKKTLIGIVLVATLVAIVFAGCTEDETPETPKASGYVYSRLHDMDQEFFYVTIERITDGRAPKISDVKWQLLDKDGTIVDQGEVDDPMVYGNITLEWNSTWDVHTTTYTDVGFISEPEDNILNSNDYFILRTDAEDNIPKVKLRNMVNWY